MWHMFLNFDKGTQRHTVHALSFNAFCHRKGDILGSHHTSFIIGGLIWCYILAEPSSVYG